MSTADTGAYRFVEHVAELDLELDAPSDGGIFDAALRAFAELTDADPSDEPAVEEIALDAGDRALLLVDWLNELVFLAEVTRFVPERVVECAVADDHLEATVEGHRGHPRHLVKAVTLNRLTFTRNGAAHARVVLDV